MQKQSFHFVIRNKEVFLQIYLLLNLEYFFTSITQKANIPCNLWTVSYIPNTSNDSRIVSVSEELFNLLFFI